MKKAFTIVELLVVMAVIGILITLAVVGIQAIQKSQRETARANDLNNLNTALIEFYSVYRGYPNSNALSWTSQTDDLNNKFKVDLEGGSQGICLIRKEVLTSPVCDVDSTNAAYFRVIKFSQLGINPNLYGWNQGPGEYGYWVSENRCDLADRKGTPEQMTIIYGVRPLVGAPSNSRQEYRLAACTENGLTKNWGTLD